eukprot:6179843-Pleurochrysis_carterae.AAC.5
MRTARAFPNFSSDSSYLHLAALSGQGFGKDAHVEVKVRNNVCQARLSTSPSTRTSCTQAGGEPSAAVRLSRSSQRYRRGSVSEWAMKQRQQYMRAC